MRTLISFIRCLSLWECFLFPSECNVLGQTKPNETLCNMALICSCCRRSSACTANKIDHTPFRACRQGTSPSTPLASLHVDLRRASVAAQKACGSPGQRIKRLGMLSGIGAVSPRISRSEQRRLGHTQCISQAGDYPLLSAFVTLV